jgi:DNA invertase Pin-like site-specific DNA recombinase
MRPDSHLPGQKVTAEHLRRGAYLYIRQSSLKQVVEHSESTQRQYALRERALALGWPSERIVVIDNDLGLSGASSADREGFQYLVGEVGLGRAGLVMGLEVSRLARNSSDWHRLLEICALSGTLILDEDGLYNPGDFNDRLLLGLKGTMSEAELHFLRARMRGGALNKARRGELKMPLPIGFLYADRRSADEREKVVFDPDRQVQQSLHCFFETFRRTGSATATVKAFRAGGLLFPRRIGRGFRKGELHFTELTHSRALSILHNPRYAGAFFYGRLHEERQADGRLRYRNRPRQEWFALFPDAHEGYISWEQFEENERRLRENAQGYGFERRKSPPREGPALLQGLVLCGRCGSRMTLRYHTRRGKQVPDYYCGRDAIEHARTTHCQVVPGEAIDATIGELLIESMTPVCLEVALGVQIELTARAEEADRLRMQQVERARYEAELARRRYLGVDPDNRLVADVLEADWNAALRSLEAAQRTYDEQRAREQSQISDELRREILALSSDFPRLWQDERTSDRERKRMVRLVIEDVTLLKADELTLHVRLRGGATRTITLPRPPTVSELRKTDPGVVAEIDRLLDDHIESEIARILNGRGLSTGTGVAFTATRVQDIRRAYDLRSRYERLRERGLLTLMEIARRLNAHPQTVKKWHRHGLLNGYAFNDKRECLYEDPGEDPPGKIPGKNLVYRKPLREATVASTE